MTPLSTPFDDTDSHETVAGLRPGMRVFGERYELQRSLGHGGMGAVWLARDLSVGDELALKFLSPRAARDPSAREELKREVRNCRQLSHPNIVRIYDFLEDREWAAISMEYIPGRSLDTLAAQRSHRIIPLTELAPWAEQICRALAYAHAHPAKIIHRDLKPANILITPEGQAKVLDFGISASAQESAGRMTRRAGQTSGTPTYMSPQQAMGEASTEADDLYSLGATLYEALTGRPPFFRGEVEDQTRSATPPSPNARRHERDSSLPPLPPEWENTLIACLAKDPARRPPSADNLAHLLRGEAPFGEPPPPEPRPPTGKRFRWAGAIIAVLGCVIFGVVRFHDTPMQGVAPQPPLVALPSPKGSPQATIAGPPPTSDTSGTLVVTSEPSELAAEIESADGTVFRIHSPHTRTLPAGRYEIVFHRENWPDEKQTIELRPGAREEAHAEFLPGVVSIVSRPDDAVVFAHGTEMLGRTPLTLTAVKPGIQSYEVRRNDYATTVVSGEVLPKQTLRLEVDLQKVRPLTEGQPWIIPDLDLALVWIPSGEFTLGTPEMSPGISPTKAPPVR